MNRSADLFYYSAALFELETVGGAETLTRAKKRLK